MYENAAKEAVFDHEDKKDLPDKGASTGKGTTIFRVSLSDQSLPTSRTLQISSGLQDRQRHFMSYQGERYLASSQDIC